MAVERCKCRQSGISGAAALRHDQSRLKAGLYACLGYLKRHNQSGSRLSAHRHYVHVEHWLWWCPHKGAVPCKLQKGKLATAQHHTPLCNLARACHPAMSCIKPQRISQVRLIPNNLFCLRKRGVQHQHLLLRHIAAAVRAVARAHSVQHLVHVLAALATHRQQ